MEKLDYEAAVANLKNTYEASLKAVLGEEEQVFKALKKEEQLENHPELAGHLALNQKDPAQSPSLRSHHVSIPSTTSNTNGLR